MLRGKFFFLWGEAKQVGEESSLERWLKAGILMFLLELADCNKIVQEIVNPLFSERKPVTFYKSAFKIKT